MLERVTATTHRAGSDPPACPVRRRGSPCSSRRRSVTAFTRRAVRARRAKAFEVNHTDEEWRQLLTPQQYDVLRRRAPRRPSAAHSTTSTARGPSAARAAAQDLFSSTTKFDSGTGWPSFSEPSAKGVGWSAGQHFGMPRTEVLCAAAAATSATFSTMAPPRPACATASTGWR